MDNILKQSPEGTTIDDVEKLFSKYEGNTIEILSELWNVSSSNVIKNQNCANIEEFNKKQKWRNIREICNTYEEEMEKYMDTMRNKSI